MNTKFVRLIAALVVMAVGTPLLRMRVTERHDHCRERSSESAGNDKQCLGAKSALWRHSRRLLLKTRVVERHEHTLAALSPPTIEDANR